jgi:hypothetical protein
MSLEVAIQENTAALRELIARLGTGSATAVTMTGKDYVESIDKKVGTTAAPKETTKPAETKQDTEAAAIDYVNDVKPLLVKVSTTKGREALISLLAKFGVDKGDKLPAEKLPEVVATVNELLAA